MVRTVRKGPQPQAEGEGHSEQAKDLLVQNKQNLGRKAGPTAFIFGSQCPAKSLAWNRSSTNKCYIDINSKNTEHTHDVPHSVLGSKKSIHT